MDHDNLDAALRRAGSDWGAAQCHGLAAGRLAVAGLGGSDSWLQQVLAGTDSNNALRAECAAMLEKLYAETGRLLSERQSEFGPLLPDDDSGIEQRTEALAHWSEGFLHGLIAESMGEPIKARLAEEPIADIVRDLLQITRAGVEADSDEEDNQQALTEIEEYLRVATQLVYEELAPLRPGAAQ